MTDSDMLDDIFNGFIRNSGVFLDRDVLRHDYLPESLPHRENQIRQLGIKVAPMLKGSLCSNVLIYGKTGTGKTAVAKYVLGHLEEKAKEVGSAIRFCYVNCRMTGSEYRVLAKFGQSLGFTVPFTGLSVGEVLERFRDRLEKSRVMFIAVLDESDALIRNQEDHLLYELTRINETLSNSKLAIIGISNDLRFKEFLDARVLSSLSEEEMVFKPYDANELLNILAVRAAKAFQPRALSESALKLCSALAAAEHGDARRALDLLRVAGEVAERDGALEVTDIHVREAEKQIEHNRISEALQNLTLHAKLVMLSVYQSVKSDASKASTGEIYDIYAELCSEASLPALTQRRLCSLVGELDGMGLLNAKLVSMGRYGRTKKVCLEVSRTEVREAFSSDSRLAQIIDYTPKCLVARVRKGTQS